ncbi:MAG TPA: hypothetical protein VLV32_08780 [Burkholderiales bacterium]|nr:hypothetical protein [Burkholderiales bacterium]
MTIATIIREANTEQEIYFLLTAYIDALQFGDKLNCLSEHLRKLPLTGLEDLRARSIKLVTELDAASKRLDDKVCTVIKEALEIFGAALSRLESFQRLSRPQRLDLQGSALGDRIAAHSGATAFGSSDSVGDSAEFRF